MTTHPFSPAAVEAAAMTAYDVRYNRQHAPRTEFEWHTEEDAIKEEWRACIRAALSAAFEQSRADGSIIADLPEPFTFYGKHEPITLNFPVLIIRKATP